MLALQSKTAYCYHLCKQVSDYGSISFQNRASVNAPDVLCFCAVVWDAALPSGKVLMAV